MHNAIALESLYVFPTQSLTSPPVYFKNRIYLGPILNGRDLKPNRIAYASFQTLLNCFKSISPANVYCLNDLRQLK